MRIDASARGGMGDGTVRRAGLVLCALLLALAATLSAAPALAQGVVNDLALANNRFVNLDPTQFSSPEASSSDAMQAQSFTVGEKGADLSRIFLYVSEVPDPAPASATISVYADSNGAPDLDDEVAELAAGSLTLTVGGPLQFDAPSGTVLEAETTYWIVVNEGVAAASRIGFYIWSTDSQGAFSWPIGDGSLQRNAMNDGWTDSASSLVLSVRGTEREEEEEATVEALVRNTNLTDTGGDPVVPTAAAETSTGVQAQAFTTGGRAVELSWIDLWHSRFANDPPQLGSVDVTVRLDNGGEPDADGTGLVATLTHGVGASSTGQARYDAPAGVRLDANTTYWVVANRGLSAASPVGYGSISDGREGEGGKAGWSIADDRLERNAGDTGWETKTGLAMFLGVGGIERTPDTIARDLLVTNDGLGLEPGDDDDSDAVQAQAFTVGARGAALSWIDIWVESGLTDLHENLPTLRLDNGSGAPDLGATGLVERRRGAGPGSCPQGFSKPTASSRGSGPRATSSSTPGRPTGSC